MRYQSGFEVVQNKKQPSLEKIWRTFCNDIWVGRDFEEYDFSESLCKLK